MQNNKSDTLASTMHLYHSPRKEALWELAPADQRQIITESGKAEFITALDVDNSSEDPAEWLYQGPWYIDFDSDDISETTDQFKVFLNKSVDEYEVDLNQIAIYASGKKGFHIEIPQSLFMPRIEPMPHLPYVFKEMAFGMYVDTLDLSVYTARKGRMWRIPNFKRPDTGTYKVQLTPKESLEMTAEHYAALVSAPRPLWAPERASTFNTGLALAFVLARNKVETSAKRKPIQDRKAAALKERCSKAGYPLPPSLLALASGRVQARDGIGFNKIALQMGVASVSLGIDAGQLVALCKGLIETHESDSHRYRSRRARITELHKAWHYAHENPAYQFSAGAVRAVLPAGLSCPDLRGL